MVINLSQNKVKKLINSKRNYVLNSRAFFPKPLVYLQLCFTKFLNIKQKLSNIPEGGNQRCTNSLVGWILTNLDFLKPD